MGENGSGQAAAASIYLPGDLLPAMLYPKGLHAEDAPGGSSERAAYAGGDGNRELGVTIDDLDRIYRENAWQIAKRSGMAGFKAYALGSESLEELTDRIADAYGLDPDDRHRLAPTRSIDLLDGAGKLKENAATLAGLKIANDARRSGALLKTGKALLRGGRGAAKAAALVGPKASSAAKIARKAGGAGGRAVPYAAIATAIYAVGSAGFFAAQARRFNVACYDLLRERLAAASARREAG
jgi:hypothetical protein